MSAIEAGVDLSLAIEDAQGKELARFELLRDPGTQAFTWDLRAEPQGEARGRRGARGRSAEPGEYTAVLKVGAAEPQRQKFSIRADALAAGR